MLFSCQRATHCLYGACMMSRRNVEFRFLCKFCKLVYIICMTQTKSLSGRDREFLRLLAEAAATNPFSDSYFELQFKIAGCDASTPAEVQYQRIVSRVSEEVRRMEEAGSE